MHARQVAAKEAEAAELRRALASRMGPAPPPAPPAWEAGRLRKQLAAAKEREDELVERMWDLEEQVGGGGGGG